MAIQLLVRSSEARFRVAIAESRRVHDKLQSRSRFCHLTAADINGGITRRCPTKFSDHLLRTACLMFSNSPTKTSKRSKTPRDRIVVFDGYSRSSSRQSDRHSRRLLTNCATQNAMKKTGTTMHAITSIDASQSRTMPKSGTSKMMRAPQKIRSGQPWYTSKMPSNATTYPASTSIPIVSMAMDSETK